MIAKLPFFFLLLLVLPALGNGGFKSQSQHVLQAVPIPQQTAVIQHQDGKETLTIWNTVQAESQELAWVLPLPATPEVIQETDASALRMIRMLCAPVVVTGGNDGLDFIVKTVPIGLLMLTGLWLLIAKRRTRTLGTAESLALVLMGVIGFFLSLVEAIRELWPVGAEGLLQRMSRSLWNKRPAILTRR